MVLGPLLRDERLPGRKFKDATSHEIAGILIGQIERLIALLNRQHAEFLPLADSKTLTAGTPQEIYKAAGRCFFRVTALSVSAAATVSLLVEHQSLGPNKFQSFLITVAAAGPVPVAGHEFVLPENAKVYVESSADATVVLSASVYDGSEPALIMNYEV